tara:strand:- start:151 stop:600 length:450 start_codon:yes stop_codon:yes gene_type:complete
VCLDLHIALLQEDSDLVLDLILLLREVIIELFDELLALFQTCNMALSAAVTLSFDHLGSFEAADHFHLETCSFDLSFVYLTGLLLSGENWLGLLGFRCLSHLFEQRLGLTNLLQLILDGHTFFRQASRQVSRRLEGAHEVCAKWDLPLL